MDDDAYYPQSSFHLTMSTGRRNRSATANNDDLHGAQDGDQDPLVAVPEAENEAAGAIVDDAAAPQAAAALVVLGKPPKGVDVLACEGVFLDLGVYVSPASPY
jgi:poly-gamma-glutamate capsule biosynthesis protein CapA/YwtB (metallophosphatase superfamily)